MSIGEETEDNEIILNASLSNSPSEVATTDSSRVFLEKINALVAMSSNAVKSGIEDIAARLKQNGHSANSTPKSNGVTAPTDPTTISNHTPSMQLSCVECGVTKGNSEEMEIHIKTEHLNWLPFQCPMCLTERASDSQMREHLHSSHQKNMSKFIYVDNVTAKRKLQVLMDKAFSLNVTKRVNANSNNIPSTSSSPYSPTNFRGMNSTTSSGRNTSTSNGSSASTATASAQAAATAIVNLHKEKEKQTAQATADFLKLLDFSSNLNGDAEQQKQQAASSSTRTTNGRKRPYVPTSATEAITTNALGGLTPAEAHLGRRLRTRMSLLMPQLNYQNEYSEKHSMKDQFDRHHGTKDKRFAIGESVYAKVFDRNIWSWLPGKVDQTQGRVVYVVSLADGRKRVVHANQLKRRLDEVKEHEWTSTMCDVFELPVSVVPNDTVEAPARAQVSPKKLMPSSSVALSQQPGLRGSSKNSRTTTKSTGPTRVSSRQRKAVIRFDPIRGN